MPINSFGFFLTSQMQGVVANRGGSQGNLCLGGAIGRFVGAGQVQNSGGVGEIQLTIDLTIHPTPTGLVPVKASETWNFSAWYRDLELRRRARDHLSLTWTDLSIGSRTTSMSGP